MADPTIQTFCCHHSNRTDMAIVIMQEFNTDAYNAVCMTSSLIGIVGAVYQVSEVFMNSVTKHLESFLADTTKGNV